jgi:hypothetical protein
VVGWERLTAWVAAAPRSLWWLIVVNVVPLVGVLALGWDLGLVLLLYWAESGVIGFYAVVRMALTTGWGALFLVPFFCIHFGMFMLVHLVFLITLFIAGPLAGGDAGDASAVERVRDAVAQTGVAVALLFVSHGYSFVRSRGERELVRDDGTTQMQRPYRRIVVMHLTIIFGAVPVALLGQPAAAVALLVVLKTGADAWSHAREHRKTTRDAAPPVPEAATATPAAPETP